MTIEIVSDQAYVQAVKNNKDIAPDEVHHVIEEKLKGITSYFWGGAVRQPIFHVMYGGQSITDDWDIIADDSSQEQPLELDQIFEKEIKEGKASLNRYDIIKWIPRLGVEIDISRFSNANMVRNKETEERSLEVSLASCDFNTGAIAYGLQDDLIYDGGAIQGLKDRIVELQYADDQPHILIARLIMHSNDMRFAIGPAALHFIKHRYTIITQEKINQKIEEYLQRKGKTKRFEEITERLTEIDSNK